MIMRNEDDILGPWNQVEQDKKNGHERVETKEQDKETKKAKEKDK